jgi:two-component system, OmpR family, sensor histidine kinase CiaH
MINRLRIKLIAINMALVTIVLGATFVAVYASTSKQMARDTYRVLERTLEERFEHQPPRIEIGGEKPPPGSPDANTPSYIAAFAAQLDQDGHVGRILAENVDVVDPSVLDQMVASALGSGQTSGILSDQNFRFLIQGDERGTIIAFADRSEETRRLASLVRTSGLVGLGSLGGFFLISLILAHWAVAPIARSFQQQRQFVADASHELKTPLTVILANTEILLQEREKTIAQQQKWVEYIKTEALRMSELVNNMLFLAKTDDTSQELAVSLVNLSEVVYSSVLPFESVAYEQGKDIESSIDAGLVVKGEPGELKRLVGILLDNAIKYTPPGGRIKISLGQDQDRIRLTVNNSGEAIPPGQLQHIFERFYRADASRVRDKGGYGLGLAIAHSIVTAHQGRIEVESSAAAGTTFTITFNV